MQSRFVGIAKIVALLAFFLPWMTVSCSNQQIMSASGWDLAFGTITITNPMTGAVQSADGSANIWLILTALLIIGGAVIAFARGNGASRITLGSALAAMLLLVIGTLSYSKDAMLREASRQQGRFDGAVDASFAAMIRVDWHFGYWLAILALVAAAGFAWLGMTGRALVMPALEPAPPSEPVAAQTVCPSCGKAYPAGVRFCAEDGSALS